jgi:hypothetical protein
MNRSSRREEALISFCPNSLSLLTSAATKGWFMGSLLGLPLAHWDHEPLRLTEARSGARVCDPQQARFMERGGAIRTALNADGTSRPRPGSSRS